MFSKLRMIQSGYIKKWGKRKRKEEKGRRRRRREVEGM
jgi:hypothetical protein